MMYTSQIAQLPASTQQSYKPTLTTGKSNTSRNTCCHDPVSSRTSQCNRSKAGFCECIYTCTHAAYTSSTPAGPRTGVHPLFLVSKSVHQDAMPIFFQRNHFLVSPPGIIPARLASEHPMALHHRIIITMPRVELSLFLTSLSRSALQHIRYLEWLLPCFENYKRALRSTYMDYLATIDLMAQAMNLPQLTLVLNLRVVAHNDWDRTSYREGYFHWPERKSRDGIVYERILGPLRRLEGLKDLFVYLRRVKKPVVGWSFLEKYEDRYVFDNDEMRWEKAIMGEGYNSCARGKPWMERFETKMVGRWRGVESGVGAGDVAGMMLNKYGY